MRITITQELEQRFAAAGPATMAPVAAGMVTAELAAVQRSFNYPSYYQGATISQVEAAGETGIATSTVMTMTSSNNAAVVQPPAPPLYPHPQAVQASPVLVLLGSDDHKLRKQKALRASSLALEESNV